MKKCKDCNVKMIEGSSLHTDYVGGVKLYVDLASNE